MTILGFISEVQDFELRVSLPGRLVGTVPITNISGPYTAALKVYFRWNSPLLKSYAP